MTAARKPSQRTATAPSASAPGLHACQGHQPPAWSLTRHPYAQAQPVICTSTRVLVDDSRSPAVTPEGAFGASSWEECADLRRFPAKMRLDSVGSDAKLGGSVVFSLGFSFIGGLYPEYWSDGARRWNPGPLCRHTHRLHSAGCAGTTGARAVRVPAQCATSMGSVPPLTPPCFAHCPGAPQIAIMNKETAHKPCVAPTRSVFIILSILGRAVNRQ